MSSDNKETTVEFTIPNSDTSQTIVEDKKVRKSFTFKDFIRISGLTLTFMTISLILIIIGIIVFYITQDTVTSNAGFWVIVVGVGIFLLTIIFGFEKIE